MQRRSLLAGRPYLEVTGVSPIIDPWSGETLGEQLHAGPEAVDRALGLAWGARAACAALPAHRRAAILHGIVEGLQARRDDLIDAIVAEAGKPVRFARGEVERCIQTFTFAAEEAKRSQGETVAMDAVAAGEGRLGLVQRFPAGVVVGIAPFNFPLNLVAHKVAPAIAAGCPWVIKPGDPTPTPALILAELAIQAGWPEDGAHVLLLSRDHAPLLVSDERPAVLSFTGSDRVGWKIKSQAGKKRVLLELGGSAAVLVQPGADLDAAADRITTGAYAYAGQVCISVQRVLAHQDIATELSDRLAVRVGRDLAWGDPNDEATISGPMIREDEADRVVSWLDRAQAAGARVLAGGGREDRRLLRPVLLDRVDHDQDLYRREVFGPAMLIEPYTDLADGIAKANDGPWGLQAGVFTPDVGDLFACMRGLEVGGIIHDDVPTFRVDHMPYGGVKDSGLGREGLKYAIAEYTEPRLLVIRT